MKQLLLSALLILSAGCQTSSGIDQGQRNQEWIATIAGYTFSNNGAQSTFLDSGDLSVAAAGQLHKFHSSPEKGRAIYGTPEDPPQYQGMSLSGTTLTLFFPQGGGGWVTPAEVNFESSSSTETAQFTLSK